MSEMKDSGVKWIGNIPSEWGVKKGKYSFSFINGFAFDSEDMNMEGEFPVVRIGDIQEGIVSFENCLYIINNKGLEQYKIKKGDLLLAMSGATVGKVGIMNSDITAYINQRVGIIRSNNIKYIYYALSTKSFSEYIDLESVGSAQPNISAEGVKNFLIPCPNYEEQKYIADFLDKSTKKIDEILKNLNNEIGLLKEYKKSLITETVTMGLNPNAEMKDSGIDWIGNIPKHWSVNRINNICKLKGRIGWQGLTTDEYIDEGPYLITGVDFSNGSIDWNNCEHVSEWRYNQAADIQIKENDLLITKDGTVGKLALVENCPEKATLNSGVLLIRSINNTYINKFLYYILYSNEFWHWFEITNLGATTITHLYQNVFAKFLVAMPNIKEQQEIVDYLNKKCEEIDNLISNKQLQIEKMERYKKSLIYEYVTGKKRVKGAEDLYG